MTSSVAIEMKDISFSYGQRKVFSQFNLQVRAGKIYTLVGKSGSGKTTALRLINGLVRPHSGQVIIYGKPFDFARPEKMRRSMGYSIQGSGLFPHMTLYENITIIARKEGWGQNQIRKRVEELCELMSLPNKPSFLRKKPRQISGGQQQRIGMARALFMSPKIMLMDEPFSALDPITRSELQKEFLSLQNKLQLTIVLVSHDLSEAFNMSHEILLLNQGRVEQKGVPSKFLLSPSSPYVKEFMDSHSPSHLLKEIYLYSVANTNVFVSKRRKEKVIISHLEQPNEMAFETEDKALAYLESQSQQAHYWVSEKGLYEGKTSSSLPLNTESLLNTSHILAGMKALLRSQQEAIPIVNKKGVFIGVFSQEALDAL